MILKVLDLLQNAVYCLHSFQVYDMRLFIIVNMMSRVQFLKVQDSRALEILSSDFKKCTSKSKCYIFEIQSIIQVEISPISIKSY